MTDDADILDILFHGCALATFVDQAIADQGSPDPEVILAGATPTATLLSVWMPVLRSVVFLSPSS
jgi:hypothetical protein